MRRVVIIACLVLLAALWLRGSMDHTLYGVGLNRHECARNGLGVTYCGAELDRYRRDVLEPLRQAEQEARRERAEQNAAEQAAYCRSSTGEFDPACR